MVLLRVLSLTAGLVCLAFSLAAADPKMEIPDHTFDFGRVVQRATVTHVFWIKSVGDDTLRILNISPGCGCTQIPPLDSSLAPGDSTQLEIILDTRTFRGYVSKTPIIWTNTYEARTRLNLHAEMVLDPKLSRPLVIEPARLDVSQFSSRPRRRAGFTIENLGTETARLIPADTMFKSFSLQLPDSVAPGQSVEATILVHEDAIEMSFQESVTFEMTTSEDRFRYTVPVIRRYVLKDRASESGG
jgi:hypothetical protein